MNAAIATSLAWTWFRTRTAPYGLRVSMSRAELIAQLANPMRALCKYKLPLICPATFRGDRRGNDRVEKVHALCIDLDEPCPDPDASMRAISSTLGDVEVFVHSTFSSQPDAFKLRAIVPLDAPASADDHRASWTLATRVLSRAGIVADRACSDPARGFYVWSLPPSGAYYTGHLNGHAWPAALAAEAEQSRRTAHAPVKSRPEGGRTSNIVERARAYAARMPVAISGAHGHDALWAVARVVVSDFRLDDAEAMHVLREYSSRCQPPWSERELLHKLHDARNARVSREMGEAS